MTISFVVRYFKGPATIYFKDDQTFYDVDLPVGLIGILNSLDNNVI